MEFVLSPEVVYSGKFYPDKFSGGKCEFTQTCQHYHPAGYGVPHSGKWICKNMEDAKETIKKFSEYYPKNQIEGEYETIRLDIDPDSCMSPLRQAWWTL